MSEIVLSALFMAFTMVRLIKGSWFSNPHYLAAATVGSVLALVALDAYSPDLEGDFFIGGLADVAGAWGGMILFDLAVGIL